MQPAYNNAGDFPVRGVSRSLSQMIESAYAVITEQPASGTHRFRYESEGHTAGSIFGENSTPGNRSFPAIKVMGCQGYTGNAYVKVRCVDIDEHQRKHPYKIVGKEGCKNGVCIMPIDVKNMTVILKSLGIQRVKKQDIEANSKNINLKAVRLRFEVYLQDDRGSFISLKPVISNIIYNQTKLKICKLSQCTASVAGGEEIILLCEIISKDDIQVRLSEERDGEQIWGCLLQPKNVHKNVAITFITPQYKNLEINRTIKAQIQLHRPSDLATSAPLPFQLIPLDSNPHVIKQRRQEISGDPLELLKRLMDSRPTSTATKRKLSTLSSRQTSQHNQIYQPTELLDETNHAFYNIASQSSNSLPSFNYLPNFQNQCLNNSRIQDTNTTDGLNNSSYSRTPPSAQAPIVSSSRDFFNVISSAYQQISQPQHNMSPFDQNSNFDSQYSDWNTTSSVSNTSAMNDLNRPSSSYSEQLAQQITPSIVQMSDTSTMNNLTSNVITTHNQINTQAPADQSSQQSNMMFSDYNSAIHDSQPTLFFYDQMQNLQNNELFWKNISPHETSIME